jgi:oligopeptidase B
MVVADVNAMAEGHNYFDYSSSEPSPDGNLLAYTTDITGNRQYVLQVKDLRMGYVLPDKLLTVDSYTWMADNHTLYYVKEDDSKRGSRLYRHALGSPVDKDELVYEEKDAEFSIDVSHTRDREFIVCQS